jgi:hypothetical protein
VTAGAHDDEVNALLASELEDGGGGLAEGQLGGDAEAAGLGLLGEGIEDALALGLLGGEEIGEGDGHAALREDGRGYGMQEGEAGSQALGECEAELGGVLGGGRTVNGEEDVGHGRGCSKIRARGHGGNGRAGGARRASGAGSEWRRVQVLRGRG